jgi:hypothetical protein
MSVTLASGVNSISTGAAFYPQPASIDLLANCGFSKMQSVGSMIDGAFASAKDNLSTVLSISQTQVKVITLKAKSEGREPTPEELAAACDPFSLLKDINTSINDKINGVLDDLNTELEAFNTELERLMKLGDQFLIDQFKALNAELDAALTAVENKLDELVGAVDSAIATAEKAIDDAIKELKAFADGLTFASLFNLDCQTDAKDAAVDSTKVADAAEVGRVVGPTVSGASNSGNLDTLPPDSTPPATVPPVTPAYWISDDGIYTFKKETDIMLAADSNAAPFGTPGNTPDGTAKLFVVRNNFVGRIVFVVAKNKEWLLYTFDEFEAQQTIGPKTRALDNKTVPEPAPEPPKPKVAPADVSFEEPEESDVIVPSADLETLKQLYLDAAKERDLASKDLFNPNIRQKSPEEVDIINRRYEKGRSEENRLRNEMIVAGQQQGIPESDLPVYKSPYKNFY